MRKIVLLRPDRSSCPRGFGARRGPHPDRVERQSPPPGPGPGGPGHPQDRRPVRDRHQPPAVVHRRVRRRPGARLSEELLHRDRPVHPAHRGQRQGAPRPSQARRDPVHGQRQGRPGGPSARGPGEVFRHLGQGRILLQGIGKVRRHVLDARGRAAAQRLLEPAVRPVPGDRFPEPGVEGDLRLEPEDALRLADVGDPSRLGIFAVFLAVDDRHPARSRGRRLLRPGRCPNEREEGRRSGAACGRGSRRPEARCPPWTRRRDLRG